MQNDVLMMGDRIIVPEKLKFAVFTQARKVVFWPGMAKDIESMVSKCSTCQKFQLQNQREPFQSHDILMFRG